MGCKWICDTVSEAHNILEGWIRLEWQLDGRQFKRLE